MGYIKKIAVLATLVFISVWLFKNWNQHPNNTSIQTPMEQLNYKQINANQQPDPADYVSTGKVPARELIQEFKNKKSKSIYLYAGTEKYGFLHILKRHSSDYCKDYSPKGTPFPAQTTGKQIIGGIKTVLLSGDTVDSKNRNIVLEYTMDINKQKSRCRLVISPKDEIITFYRIDKKYNKNDF